MAEIPAGLQATTDDYVTFVGEFEAIESTNPDDASATTVDIARLQNALDLAYKQIRAADLIACPAGKVLLRTQLCFLQMRIARWILDTVKQREDIKQDWERAIETLQSSCSEEVCKCDPKLNNDQLTELGLVDVVCPSIVIDAAPRTWKKDDPKADARGGLDTFRRGRFLADR